jgi:hypothetical protein
MALIKSAPKSTYLSIVNGKIAQSVPEGTDGAVVRAKKNGGFAHELIFDQVSGIITDISVDHHEEYGDSWVVTIRDVDESFKLKFNYSGGYANGFLMRIKNVDLSKPVVFAPFQFEKDSKTRSFLVLYQGGKKIDPFYTMDNPKGLPQMEKIVFKGKEAWDDTKKMAFLQNMIDTEIVPELQAARPVPAYVPDAENYVAAGDDDSDSLPF